jgi:hypothetical protein
MTADKSPPLPDSVGRIVADLRKVAADIAASVLSVRSQHDKIIAIADRLAALTDGAEPVGEIAVHDSYRYARLFAGEDCDLPEGTKLYAGGIATHEDDFHDTLYSARCVLHLDLDNDAKTGNEIELSVGMTAGPDDALTIYLHAKDEIKLAVASPESAPRPSAALVGLVDSWYERVNIISAGVSDLTDCAQSEIRVLMARLQTDAIDRCRHELEAALSAVSATPGGEVALNTMHPKCHEAAHAFWNYWNANGETHKRGYYESTWGAINRALRVAGVVPHDYGNGAAPDCRGSLGPVEAPPNPLATPAPAESLEALAAKWDRFGVDPLLFPKGDRRTYEVCANELRTTLRAVSGGREYSEEVGADGKPTGYFLFTTPAAPALPDGDARGVVVSKQGVRFGPNCWISHEQITSRTAEELNAGAGIIAREYMQWVSENMAAAPQREGG